MIGDFIDPILDKTYYEYDELPEWYQDNKHIIRGYRSWNRNYLYYLKSILKCHNETLNIWTHLLGSIIFIFLTIYTFRYNFNLYSEYLGDTISMFLFLFSSITCFSLSSLMHCFYPKSNNTCKCLLLGDYYGIIFLMLCSYNVFIYYLFYCDYYIQKYYYIFINIYALISIFLLKYIINKKNYIYKILVLSLFIISILIPVSHHYIYFNNEHSKEFNIEITFYTSSLCVYFFGFFFYFSKIPESLCSHKYHCVNYLTSHSIFHTIILIATLINYYGMIKLHNVSKFIDCKNITSFY